MVKVGDLFVCTDTRYHGCEGRYETYTDYRYQFNQVASGYINANDYVFVVQEISPSASANVILFYSEKLNWTSGQTKDNYTRRFRPFVQYSKIWRDCVRA